MVMNRVEKLKQRLKLEKRDMCKRMPVHTHLHKLLSALCNAYGGCKTPQYFITYFIF